MSQSKPSPSRRRKFFNDLGIYAIGNLGSKLITFLLVPFYTYFITDPAQYGYFDVSLTVIFCCISLISLQLTDGSFRFLMDTDAGRIADRRAIITFTYRTLIVNSCVYVCLGLVLGLFVEIPYLIYILLYAVAQTFYDVSLQVTRGLKRTTLYVSASIINTLCVAIFAILFIAVMQMGLLGLFLSNILAKAVAVVYMEMRIQLFGRYFRIKSIDKALAREMLRYSLPLMPTVLCWWLISSNSVFFIKHFCGLLDNGIYAVLCKFIGILHILALIFYQTWQQNAIEQFHSADRDRFFTAVFNNYFLLLSMFVCIFPFGLRLNYFWLVSEQYAPSARYLFVHSICVMVFALGAFFEVAYQCSKNTRRLMPAFVAGAVLSVALNYIMIPAWGLYGAILSNFITFMFLCLYRAIDSRRYVKIRFDRKNYLSVAMIAASCLLYYISPSPLADAGFLALIFIAFIILAPKEFINAVLSRLPVKKF